MGALKLQATEEEGLIIDIDENIIIPSLRPYLNNSTPVQLFTGTAGSGKSVFLLQRCIIYALTKDYFRLLYCRKQAVNIKESIFQGFKDVIAEWGLNDFFRINSTTMEIVCTLNGNKMIAHGLDKVERVKSIKDISHVFVDEMSELTFDDFSQLQLRLRTKKVKQTQFWGAFNPIYQFKWGKKHFFIDQGDKIPLGEVPSSDPNVLIVKTHYKDNEHIDEKEYTAKIVKLADGDENYMRVYGQGDWGKSAKGHEYYRNWKASRHVVPCKYIPLRPIHVSFDFNTLPYVACSIWQIDDSHPDGRLKVRCIKTIALPDPRNSINDTCQELEREYEHWLAAGLYVYADASGISRIPIKEFPNYVSVVQFELRKWLQRKNLRLLTQNPKHNAVGTDTPGRRDFVAHIMSGMYGIDIEVDPSCELMIEDFENVKQNDSGAKLKQRIKVGDVSYEPLGHFSDTFDALVCFLYGEWAKREAVAA